jgi:hypothetical protein
MARAGKEQFTTVSRTGPTVAKLRTLRSESNDVRRPIGGPSALVVMAHA